MAKEVQQPAKEQKQQEGLTPAMRARFQEIWRGMDLAVAKTIEQDVNQIPEAEHRELWSKLVGHMMKAAEVMEEFRVRSGL